MELLLSFFVSEAIPASSPFHIPFMNGKDDFLYFSESHDT